MESLHLVLHGAVKIYVVAGVRTGIVVTGGSAYDGHVGTLPEVLAVRQGRREKRQPQRLREEVDVDPAVAAQAGRLAEVGVPIGGASEDAEHTGQQQAAVGAQVAGVRRRVAQVEHGVVPRLTGRGSCKCSRRHQAAARQGNVGRQACAHDGHG